MGNNGSLQGCGRKKVRTLEPLETGTGLELAEGSGQHVSQRKGARAGNQQSESKKQLGKRKFVPAVVDVEAMGYVNEKNCAEHDDYHADCTDPQKSAGKNGEASGELSQADEIADGCRGVHESGKVRRSRSAEYAKKNGAAVIEKWQGAGQAQDQQGKIELR